MRTKLLTLALLLLATLAVQADVTINQTNFPDANFRSYLLSLYPKGYLTNSEVQNLTTLDVSSKNISNMKGVELLTYLQTLKCQNNRLTSLVVYDGYNNTLRAVYCDENPNLISIKFTGCKVLQTLSCENCTALDTLRCYSNDLINLDVSGCTALTWLQCHWNPNLSSIDGLNQCKALKLFHCNGCAFTNIDVVNTFNDLENLICYGNHLRTIKITNKRNLTKLDAGDDDVMYKFTVTGCPRLKFAHCSNCPALETIICHDNEILEVLYMMETPTMSYVECYNCPQLNYMQGIENCTQLDILKCYGCNIRYFEWEKLQNLTQLFCHDNKLEELDLSGHTKLRWLYCENNQLSTLDVRGCSALTDLICCNNQLTSLDVQGCSALNFIRCDKNQISGEGMTTLVGSLPARSADNPGTLRVINNFDSTPTENNAMAAAQIATATAKHWTAEHYIGYLDWVEYSATTPGDVDGDGQVTIGDGTAIIDLILSRSATVQDYPAADVDGDGQITIGDVTAIIDALLNN